jgi:Ni/Fe-hydrogenase subunit HybB-like protein
MSYLVLAGISTPLVLSVHSTVSFDFATSLIPGWHTTIFPPYFVAGAIFGGFAMVLTLLIPARSLYKLHDVITWNHIDVMCKIILLTGSMVGYSYFMEFLVAYYGANPFERFIFLNRYFGPYWWVGYGMFTCNVIIPQLFWIRAFRRNIITVYFVAMCVNVGMWYERFAIIAVSLHRDFLPSSSGDQLPEGHSSPLTSLFPGTYAAVHSGRIDGPMTAAARKRKVFGVIAEFGSAAELYRAAEQVRDRGYRFWDVH